ncbi:hypothetical protein I3843_04G140600 [Carya illinoinensis]|nr:hypothetical protein I3843_04G140600 [Carya illinoinensis]
MVGFFKPKKTFLFFSSPSQRLLILPLFFFIHFPIQEKTKISLPSFKPCDPQEEERNLFSPKPYHTSIFHIILSCL